MDGGRVMDDILEQVGEVSSVIAADEKPLGPFQLADKELVAKLRMWLKEASTQKAKGAKRRERCHKMYAGDQWEQADRDIASDAKRPALTLNMILNIVSALEGEERTNRQEIKFYGSGKEDDEAAWGLNRLLKWIDKSSGGEFALSAQFRNGNIGGEAWIVPEVDYFDDPEGLIKLVSVPDLEIYDDPLSTCPVGSDSRYRHRVKLMTEEELEARWPGTTEKIEACMMERGFSVETDGKGYRDIYEDPSNTSSMKLYDSKTKLWSVVETWWHQIEPGVIIVNDKTGLLEEVSPQDFEKLKAEREAVQQQAQMANVLSAATGAAPAEMPGPIESTERPVRHFYQAFWCCDVMIAKQPSPMPKLKRIPYIPFRCYYDSVKGEWFGPVDQIVDPQRQHNVEQSVIVQLMQLMPKASWMGPKGSFHNKTEWANKVAQPGAMLEYNQQRGKPEQIQTPAIPRHLIDMAFTRPETMRSISGVNVELTGQRQGSDAGVVMEQRRKAAKTVLAPIFDNFRQTKIELGRVLLNYIQTYISPGRQIRVIGPEGAQAVTMTADMALGRYDITVDETESSVNDRTQTMTLLQTLLPALANAGVSMIPEMVELIPMEPHVRDAMKRQLSWDMTIAKRLPPPGWQPGMAVPMGAIPPAPNVGAPEPQ